jgi:hypothetical protein
VHKVHITAVDLNLAVVALVGCADLDGFDVAAER